MTGATHTERLERSYRRLLACYPAGHRAIYDEEMIGVLMSAATPDQRRPGTREALNLVVSGLSTRLRTTLRAVRRPAWRDAASVFGYVTSVMIAATSAYQVVAGHLAGWHPSGGLSRTGVALAIGWMLVAIAAGLGWRRTAAAGATVGALGQATTTALMYVDHPDTLVTSWWRLVLAIATAASLVVLVRPPLPMQTTENRPRPLGARSAIAVAAAAILICVAPLVESRMAVTTQVGPDARTESYRMPLPRLAVPVIGDRPVTLVVALVLLATLATVALRLNPPIRRRVLLLAAPAAATALLVAQVFNGFLMSSPRFSPPVQLAVPQWIGLVATPVLAFTIGAAILARYERKLASGELLAQPQSRPADGVGVPTIETKTPMT